MKMKKASKGQTVISFIIGILLMLTIIVSILSLLIKFVVLNSNTYYKVLETKDIYNEIHNVIDDNISYALTVNNLSQDINKDIISVDEVKSEVQKYLGAVIEYLKTGTNNISDVNTDVYMERFNKNLNNFFNKNSIVLTNQIKSEIDLLKKDVKQIIESELQIINVKVIKNNSIFTKIAKITSLFVSKLYLVSIIASIILILLLFIVWRTDYVRLLQWIGNSFMSAGLLIFLIFFSGYMSKFYEHISINTLYLKNFVSSIIGEVLGTLSLWGVYIIIIGVVLIMPKIMQAIKLSKMERN